MCVSLILLVSLLSSSLLLSLLYRWDPCPRRARDSTPTAHHSSLVDYVCVCVYIHIYIYIYTSLSLSLSISLSIYIYISYIIKHMYIYIYIYIRERERERESEQPGGSQNG